MYIPKEADRNFLFTASFGPFKIRKKVYMALLIPPPFHFSPLSHSSAAFIPNVDGPNAGNIKYKEKR